MRLNPGRVSHRQLGSRHCRRRCHATVALLLRPSATVTAAMVYAAKCYWPGVSKDQLQHAAGIAQREAEELSRSGKPVAYLGALLFPDDELVLFLFDSASRGAVTQANERAGIPCERLMQSVWLARPTVGGSTRCTD